MHDVKIKWSLCHEVNFNLPLWVYLIRLLDFRFSFWFFHFGFGFFILFLDFDVIFHFDFRFFILFLILILDFVHMSECFHFSRQGK